MKNPLPNRFISNLAGICRHHLLAEKWLIAPNLRVGHQWIEQVARSGQPAVNLRVTTVLGLALQFLSSAGREVTLLPGQAHEFMVDRLWDGLKDKQKDPYLATIQVTPGFLSRLSFTISDLRMAGVTAGQMDAGHFEVGAKGLEVAALYGAYCRQLDALDIYDSARVLEEAARLDGLAGDSVALVPDFIHLQGLEGRFASSLPGEKLLKVPGETAVDLSAVVGGGRGLTVSFATALGETAEVRNIFRRCLSRGIPLDQVEVLYTDQESYLPLLFEESVRLARDHVTDVSDPPVTFADGIPTRFTRPGRALMAWVDWIREGFPQPVLLTMVRNGLLVTDGNIPAARMARLLRNLPVGRGRNRFLPVMVSRVR
ncbi:MAG: hypothetical protein JSV26_00550 [bacterium]|nr:MAG: hypothetical protein JSV26_00550 [bacterium]